MLIFLLLLLASFCAVSSSLLDIVLCSFFSISLNIIPIFQVARETNEELRAIKADPAEGFDVGAILSVARRYRPLTKVC